MKTLYKLLLLVLFVSVSNNIFAQITIEQAVAIDENKDGYYDAMEIKFSEPISDVNVKESYDVNDCWRVGDTDDQLDLDIIETYFSTTVKYIANTSDTNDRYVKLKFNGDDSRMRIGSGFLYFRYDSTRAGNGNALVKGFYSGDTLIDIPLDTALDRTPPIIYDLTSAKIGAGVSNYVMVDDTIKFTVIPLLSELSLTVLPEKYNGQDLNWETDDGSEYVGKYPVVEGDLDQLNPIQLLGVSLIDTALNQSDTLNTTDVVWSIDANTPVIVGYVTSNATGTDTLKAGGQIIFTVDVEGIDGSLMVTSDTYNNQTINWYTSDGGDTYKGIYTVGESDASQYPAPEITGVILTDPAGNASAPGVSIDVEKSIDTDKPGITSVVFNPSSGVKGINDTINVTITSNPIETNLKADTLIINNTYVSSDSLHNNGNGTYYFTYTIDEGDNEIAEYEAIPISFVLQDLAGNLSKAYTTSVAESCPGIDTKRPTIVDVTSDATGTDTLKVGDKITFTVDITVPDGSLTIEPVNFNGQPLNWYTKDGGSTYTGVYIVTEGDNDTTHMNLIGVKATDPAGNESNIDESSDVTVAIDANSPTISSFKLLNKPKIIGEIDTLTLGITEITPGGYILVSGSVAGFDISGIEKFDTDSLWAFFTIQETGSDILNTSDIKVVNLQIQDSAGNVSNTINDVISQLNDPMYTTYPTAKVSGTYSVCDGNSVDLIFQLTGNAPWEIKLDSCSTLITIDNISESPFIYTVYTNNPAGTDIYKITQVTDVNGNVKVMPSPVSATVNINALPDVSFSEPNGDQTYNIDAGPQLLEGNQTEGFFSGNGVSANDTAFFFLPAVAGIGPHEITYTYIESSAPGCSNSTSIELTVDTSNAFITFENNDAWRCRNEISFKVSGEVIGKPSIHGTLKLNDAPAAISSTVNDTAEINLQLLSAGTYEVTFEYFDSETRSVTKSFTIDSVSADLTFNDIPDQCANYETIFVNTVNRIPSGGTGVFTFSGDAGAFKYEPTDLKNNSGYFLPGKIDPGFYTLQYVYTTTNGCQSNPVVKSFNINALPDVSFAIGTESVYNIDQGESEIIGVGLPAGGVGEFVSTLDFIDDNGDGTAVINPDTIDLGNQLIIYTYTDGNGCVEDDTLEIEVKIPIGEIISSSGDFRFCYDDPVEMFTGIPNPTDDTPGRFYVDNTLISPESDNTILFNPQDYLAGDHMLRFEYDSASTIYSVSKPINIDSIGNISFTGLDPSYCEDQNSAFLLTASTPTGDLGNVIFSGNGISNVADDWYFNPFEKVGEHNIKYTFERNYSGCKKEITKTTKVNGTPFVDFNPNEICIVGTGDSIGFTADTLISDSIVSWTWKFRNVYTSNDPNPRFPPAIGSNNMELTLETNKGCAHKETKTFLIGTKVDLKFTYENECHGETVLFDLVTSSLDVDIDSVKWNFGGEGVSDLSDLEKPTHKYTNAGGYDVVYEEYLKTCGRIADTVRINIRPSIFLSLGEYNEEFEDSPDVTGWVIENFEEGVPNTWQWGEPAGTKISTAASGTSAYVTNLDGNYANGEKGMITSPCFDFSSLQRPMMKMDFISYTENDRDGAVIQYTKPNGDWATIGVPNDGVNWYNSYIILGAPANQQLGWTGKIVSDNNTGWQTAMYRLDELRGRAGVRFRIVFGSDAVAVDEGFAFDNIRFGERKRMVLLENFTNITDDVANNTQSNIIDPILVKDSLDVINLNYHTSFPDANNFNMLYPSGPSARALYYGVSDVPYSIIDGGERHFDYLLGHNLTESDVHKRVLIDPQFDISVKQDIQNSNFVISSKVEALEEISGQNVIVYVAVVEKTVVTGSEKYNNVLRTMLPDAAGILYEKDWTIGDYENVYLTCPIPENANADSLITIVFIQDDETKEIYQTAFAEEYSTITSIDEIIDNIISNNYVVYPNPVKEVLSVKLYKTLTYDLDVNVYNSVGAIVKSGKLIGGDDILEINTRDIPAGVYYLRLTNSDKFFGTSKIIKTD